MERELRKRLRRLPLETQQVAFRRALVMGLNSKKGNPAMIEKCRSLLEIIADKPNLLKEALRSLLV